MKTSVDNLAASIKKELEEYRQDVTDDLKKTVKEVAKDCAQEIKEASPVKSGRYKKGWKSKTVFESQEDIRIAVHNATDYQLAHLLEHGHALANGGRAEGKPHIGPAAQHAEERLEKKVKVIVKG